MTEEHQSIMKNEIKHAADGSVDKYIGKIRS
jgi:hypothetical protein